MADESKGVLGHLPPLPRKAINNSVIGMEQAYRQRKGLPLLSDTDIEALKAGEPMPWERGDGGSSTATTVATSVPAAPAESAPPAASSASAPASGVISEEVAKWVAEGKKWSKSAIAAEQARRGRKGLPALTDAEVTALLGEPAPQAAAAPAPSTAAKPAAPAARPAAAAARGGESTRYVGTPAVGTSKAAAAGGVASVGPEDSEINRGRRRFAWTAVAAFLTAWFLAFFRFFLPRTLFEPANRFTIGYKAEYALGVDTK